MSIATGTVVEGKIVVERLTLPQGTVVAALAADGQRPVRLPTNLERELLEAIDEADAQLGGEGPEFLDSLCRYG